MGLKKNKALGFVPDSGDYTDVACPECKVARHLYCVDGEKILKNKVHKARKIYYTDNGKK